MSAAHGNGDGDTLRSFRANNHPASTLHQQSNRLSCALNTGLRSPLTHPLRNALANFRTCIPECICFANVTCTQAPTTFQGEFRGCGVGCCACVAVATVLLCSGACPWKMPLTERRVLPLPVVKRCNPFWALPSNGGNFFAAKKIAARRQPASPVSIAGLGVEG